MELNLTYVGRFQKTSKAGKPYTSMSIKTREYGDKFISGFGGKENESWKSGDTVEADVEQKGEYLNFSVPKGSYSKSAGAPDSNRLEVKTDLALSELRTIGAEITSIKSVLGDILQTLKKDEVMGGEFNG